MLLTLTTRLADPSYETAAGAGTPLASATDLGYLLHKNPTRVQEFELNFGRAHVFYPVAEPERCTAALLLEVDPIALVRGREGSGGTGTVEQYVNDRPYAASSFLSVAIAGVFGSALAGRCRERPDLAAASIYLEAEVEALPCRGGEAFVRRLFEPLGYAVEAQAHPLDTRHPEGGASPYFRLRLSGRVRLSDLLAHLYVLIPVLDDEKHYWIGEDEVKKLLRRGAGWLSGHPERETIARRYLGRRHGLVREALRRLAAEDTPEADEEAALRDQAEEKTERRLGLNEQRLGSVLAVLKGRHVRRVLDLGCGDGKLLKALLSERQFEEIVGVDVSSAALERAERRLRLDRLPRPQAERIRLLHGALTYRDHRLGGYDAAAIVEVIEHLDPPRLHAFERVVFQHARPRVVVVTTPNREYNARWENLPADRFRHRDHRFEWDRCEFTAWAGAVAARFGYDVSRAGIGPEDPELGSPTQMAIFDLPSAGSVPPPEEADEHQDS
jgi:3' terminal RNA ribose 2'-O-methyltransferase Hen1